MDALAIARRALDGNGEGEEANAAAPLDPIAIARQAHRGVKQLHLKAKLMRTSLQLRNQQATNTVARRQLRAHADHIRRQSATRKDR